jgi:hypothetical protein
MQLISYESLERVQRWFLGLLLIAVLYAAVVLATAPAYR